MRGDAWIRSVLWQRYTQLFKPGQTVLDVGCGTGIDALFMAGHGIRVVGIDASPAMIAQANAKLQDAALRELVELSVTDASALESLPQTGFDGIVSAFASLSTLADLDRFGVQSARLLRPGGVLVLHLLNRTSLWEWIGLVRAGRWREARELDRNLERNFIIGGRSVRHYLHHAREAYARFFASRFRLRRAYGLGILRPPHTVRRIPRPVVIALDRMERPVRTWRPFVNWGRFFVLELERR